MLVRGRPSPPATPPALFTTGRANKVAAAVQVGVGAWVLAGALLLSALNWFHDGGGRPRPELYGIWTVTSFTRDGVALPPLTTQPDRWRRLIIEDPDTVAYQRMDGVIVTVPVVVDAHSISVPDAAAPSTLTVERTAPDRLRLFGQLQGHPVTITLRRLDLDRFPLYHDRFHWVQRYPDIPLEQ